MYVIVLPYLPRWANVAFPHHTFSDNVFPSFLYLLELAPTPANASPLLPQPYTRGRGPTPQRISNLTLSPTWTSCPLNCLKMLARIVSNASHLRRSRTPHATPNPTQTTLSPRFLSSEIAPRHSRIYRTNLLLRSQIRPLDLPRYLTSPPLSCTSARSRARWVSRPGKTAG
jgi:hypothetical protein